MKDISDRQVCDVIRDMWTPDGKLRPRREYPDATLARLTGQPEKVCFRALERAVGRGLLDYGTWVYGSWLTDKGRELLEKNG